jgi:hypothetical protein
VLGDKLGLSDGDLLGETETLGDLDGDKLGLLEGLKLGLSEGEALGEIETLGDLLGLTEGESDGDLLGDLLGLNEGDFDGLKLGDLLGDNDGLILPNDVLNCTFQTAPASFPAFI